MNPETIVYLKIVSCFVTAMIIFKIMSVYQKEKEAVARKKFRLYLLSKGINPDLEEK